VSCVDYRDGEEAKTLPLRPADLTEPHTALHTAGDIFWWLTHGKPPGSMPGFRAALSEDDRWDLINFVRTLSAGYQARIIGERVVPERPWLPAVDFGYTTAEGETASLKDFRGRGAVLLVFFRGTASQARMAQLGRMHQQLRAAGVEVLAVPIDDAGARSGLPLPVVTEGAEETVRTYALLRRTLSNADPRDERPLPEHMELLIDRFGYVRARWIPGAGEGWRDAAVLLQQAALLAREKQILPPPEDHVH
jgi:putative copper resistance protein D